MAEKILAASLLVFGGSVTLFVLYRAALAVLQPVIQKKMQQKMQEDKFTQVENNLLLHHPVQEQGENVGNSKKQRN